MGAVRGHGGADLRDGAAAAALAEVVALVVGLEVALVVGLVVGLEVVVVAARYGSDTAEEPQGEAHVHFPPLSVQPAHVED